MNILASDHPEQAKVDATVLRYRVYTRRIRRMLYLGGVLQDRTRSAAWSYTTGLLVIFMCFNQCVFMINFCWDHTDDLVLLSRCFGMTCSFITPVLMSACFLVKRKRLLELHETLDDLFERELARDRQTMLATLCAFDRPSYMLCFTLGSTALMILCPSLISIVRQIVYDAKPRRYKLPFLAKFPWPVSTGGGLLFYLHLLHQISTCWCVVFTVGSVDSLFGYYAFQISSILRAMSARLANRRRTCEVFTEALGTCVHTHYRLLQCSHMLSDIWGLIIIRMLFTNAILMCALIFEASPGWEGVRVTRYLYL